MILYIKILTEASIDIKEITGWYKNVSQSLAARFVSQRMTVLEEYHLTRMHGLI